MEKLYARAEECCGCGACLDACGAGAIRMAPDREGFLYPEIDAGRCVECGRCLEVCPLKRRDRAEAEPRQFFGAQARDQAVRRASSSGGVFPLLAQYVLQRQGSVYGAAYGEHMRVAHREARRVEELDGLKRTKYVQSSLEGVFRGVEARLKQGRWVLFCATPCQAEGLRLYLGRPYPRLILADLICYGAPSPGVWADYVAYLEKKHGGPVTDFSFRDKRMGDNGHTRAYAAAGREYSAPLYQDRFCQMYFSNHILRPACHACPFAAAARNSDITIGDFWGVEKVRPEVDDGMGTSLVILHTAKGRQVWEQVRGQLSWFACGEEEALQPRLIGPTPAPKTRGLFWRLYRALPFGLVSRLHGALVRGGALISKKR